MTGFNHVLTGVAIAVTVRQPLLAPALALGSHFALDALPHFWHEKLDTWAKPLITMVLIDAVLSFCFLTAGLLFFPDHRLLITVCAALATLPDWLWLLRYKFGVQHAFFDFHQKIQRYERPWGFWIELPFMCGVLALLWILAR